MPDLRNDENIKKLPQAVQTKLFNFIASIPKTRFYKPDGKPKKEWKIFYGDTWDSARNSALDSARDSARNSAWYSARDSAWDSAWYSARNSALDSAWYSARDSAWDSALDSARNSALDSARDSARDSALLASFIIVDDLKFKDKKKHYDHAKARWEVWQKGYGLLCDVDGVLYVYAVKPKK